MFPWRTFLTGRAPWNLGRRTRVKVRRFARELICQLIQQVRFQTAIRGQHLISRPRAGRVNVPSCNLHTHPHNRSTSRRRGNLELRLIVPMLKAVQGMIRSRETVQDRKTSGAGRLHRSQNFFHGDSRLRESAIESALLRVTLFRATKSHDHHQQGVQENAAQSSCNTARPDLEAPCLMAPPVGRASSIRAAPRASPPHTSKAWISELGLPCQRLGFVA